MKNKKKKAFTLVELLAVIVILAIILVIAIPQIIKTIKASKLSAMESSAKLIATEADKDFLSQLTLNQYYSATSVPCEDVAKLSDDYESCTINYDENGVSTVTLVGAMGKKFAGITCTGTKDNMECTESEIEDLPTIMAWTSTSDTDFHKSNIRTTITEIEFVDLNKVTAPTVNNTTSWDVSEAKDNSVIAWLDGTKLYIGGKGGVKANTDSSNIFRNFTNLTNINFNNKYKTNNVTNMSYMFADGAKLESLDLKSFDTSKVTDMSGMFYGCKKIKLLDLSNFDTSNVTTMRCMFDYGNSTSDSETMEFETIDLSGKFILKSVINTEWMFSKCQKLKTIFVNENNNIDIIENSNGMFYNCKNLIGGNGTKYSSSYTNKTYAKIDKDGQKGYFTDKKNYGNNYMPNMVGMSLYTDFDEYSSGNIWNNKIGSNDIQIYGNAIKEDDGSITLTGNSNNNYGSVDVGKSTERTIYIVAKEKISTQNYWSPIFTSAITNNSSYYALDIFSSNNIVTSSSIYGDISSNVNSLKYNAIAIVSNGNTSKYMFYINGEYIGMSTAYTSTRNNMMYLNAVYRNGLFLGSNPISYKFLAVSKINQSENEIVENLNWLVQKYGIVK